MTPAAAPVRLGISQGGGVTTVVLLDADGESTATARATGKDQLRVALRRALRGCDASGIRLAMLATAEPGRWLTSPPPVSRVGVLRIGTAPTSSIPPFAGWPEELKSRVTGPALVVAGAPRAAGLQARELDLGAIREFASRCRDEVDAVVVAASFSPWHRSVEAAAAQEISDVAGSALRVSVSSDIGGAGLIERENTSIMNATLVPRTGQLVAETERALSEAGLTCDLFLMQNDGTLMSSAVASRLPIHLAAGHLASVVVGGARGNDSIVIDCDAGSGGAYRSGHLVSEPVATIAGVRLNLPLPVGFSTGDYRSIDDLTRRLQQRIGNLPVVRLSSSEGSTPAADASARAAALAPVSARVWGFVMPHEDRATVLEQVSRRAIDEAILAGADPSDTRITSLEQTQLTYVKGEAVRVVAHATGRPFDPSAATHGTPREREAPWQHTRV